MSTSAPRMVRRLRMRPRCRIDAVDAPIISRILASLPQQMCQPSSGSSVGRLGSATGAYPAIALAGSSGGGVARLAARIDPAAGRRSGTALRANFRLIVDGPSKRGCCHPRSSLTPPCGTTAVGSSGTTHEAVQAWVMRGRSKG
jgi:hypothetical protein